MNLIGALAWGATRELCYRVIESNVTKVHVAEFLNALAERCCPARVTVVVLDNAPFHRARGVQERREAWEAKGLFLRFLPPYCPHLNLIEVLWRRVKSFLLPRRCYDSVAQLRTAVVEALDLFGARPL